MQTEEKDNEAYVQEIIAMHWKYQGIVHDLTNMIDLLFDLDFKINRLREQYPKNSARILKYEIPDMDVSPSFHDMIGGFSKLRNEALQSMSATFTQLLSSHRGKQSRIIELERELLKYQQVQAAVDKAQSDLEAAMNEPTTDGNHH